MPFVKITFPVAFTPETDRQALASRVSALAGEWTRNGQLLCMARACVIEASGIAPYADAFDERAALLPASNSVGATHQLAALKALGAHPFVVTVLGESVWGDTTCDCEKSSTYILFTTLSSEVPPLRCGQCRGAVRLYDLPLKTELLHARVELHDWARDYEAYEGLQMNCGTGERFAERQMGTINSALTRKGRQICTDIEAKTGAPTYYYLCRARALSLRAEHARRCPSCGGEWRLDNPLLDLFDFQCNDCRLVSNIAFDIWLAMR